MNYSTTRDNNPSAGGFNRNHSTTRDNNPSGGFNWNLVQLETITPLVDLTGTKNVATITPLVDVTGTKRQRDNNPSGGFRLELSDARMEGDLGDRKHRQGSDQVTD